MRQLINTIGILTLPTPSELFIWSQHTSPLDYKSRALRCQHCFSYRHLPKHCVIVNPGDSVCSRSETRASTPPEHYHRTGPRSREPSPQRKEPWQSERASQRAQELQGTSASQGEKATLRERESCRSHEDSWRPRSTPINPAPARTNSGPSASARV